jgi:DNA modification methylase
LVFLIGEEDFAIDDRTIGDIWQEKWASARPTGHPQEKPVSLIKRIMNVSGVGKGAIVLDPFMGSGTTGMACVQTGRNFVGIEIDKGYFDIAKARIEKVARNGQQLELEVDDGK